MAQDTLRFIKLLQTNSSKIKVPKRYSSELNLLIGQIVDIARMVLLQNIGTEGQADPSSPQAKVLVPPESQHSAMTSGTSTLNIIQIQKQAFNEERLQGQMGHIIKKMVQVRAKRVEEYAKLQDEDKGSQSEVKKDDSKETAVELKSFVSEFQTQVLGVGKAPVQNQSRFGGGGQAQQNLSYPSNELAN